MPLSSSNNEAPGNAVFRRKIAVGVTGGIGSGKSIVCRVFATLGIPVFNADDAAKYLMENDGALRQSIVELIGGDSYVNGKLNRNHISTVVYSHPEKLNQLNAIVHPATVAYGNKWIQQQNAPYLVKEAAIFFESGSYKNMDIMVGVFAPLEVRVARAMKRGNLSREKVLSIVGQQMDEDEKMSRCDHVITNDDTQAILPQVLALHDRFYALSSK